MRRSPGQALIGAGLAGAVAVAPLIFSPWLFDNFTLPKQSVLLGSAALICLGLAMEGQVLPPGRWLRVSIVAWVVALTVSTLAGIDRWGSLLGYYQYRQGYLTQLAYITCLLGAWSLTRRGADGWLPIAGTVGLTGALAYSTIQAVDLDPIVWWIDTSERTIGTIGNANELAAYALIALALVGGSVHSRSRHASLVVGAVTAAVSLTILETESRTGLAAFSLGILLVPLVGLIRHRPRRTIGKHSAALLAGSAIGVFLGVLVGSVGGTADRVERGDSEAGGSTRLALWQGTVPAVMASPALGYGPDGLHLAFPQHRPDDLGGVFRNYDLVAQSSHNWLLDTAANTGLPGLAALVLLLGCVVVASTRSRAGEGELDEGFALRVSAMVAYGVLTLFNPISMAAHALFFVLLGVAVGRAEEAPPGGGRRSVVRLSVAGAAAVPAVAIALALPLADREAHSAWAAYAGGDFVEAAQQYRRAARWLPFERSYASREAGAWLAAGVGGGPGSTVGRGGPIRRDG